MKKCINRHGNKDSYDEIWGCAKEPFQDLEKVNEIISMTMELGESIKIDDFTIYTLTARENHTNSFWIQRDDGEGMQVQSARLGNLLNQFWADEF